MTNSISFLKDFLRDKRLTYINGLYIVTDEANYEGLDQVLPMYPEQLFFFAELNPQQIQGATVLEIGLGSGVLSIGCVKAGAKQVVALEINPRAKELAKFNFGLNQIEDQIHIVNGDRDIFKPVVGEKFDYIISNPPFEPTPPDADNYVHSAAGIYGLDFLISIFEKLDTYLFDTGHGQIVTGVPGNDQGPSMLLELVDKYLPGQTTVVINPIRVSFETVMDFFVLRGLATLSQVNQVKQIAKNDGITQFYLCVIHYEKGPKAIKVETSVQEYRQWGLPIKAISRPKDSMVRLVYQIQNQPPIAIPTAPSLPILFELQTNQNPTNLAIVSKTDQLTYQQLNQQANQVAWRLQQLGVKPEMLVGLNIEPSIEMLVGVLGILKAGGAFVPLDPTYPAERLAYLVSDAQLELILTTQTNLAKWSSLEVTLIDVNTLRDDQVAPLPNQTLSQPYHLACVLYTSGSTGQPKGVLLEHSALTNHAASLQQAYQLTPADRVLQFAPLNHIAGVEQILITWLVGACLVLREPKLWTPLDFPAKVHEYGLTVCDLPSGYYQVLVDSWTHQTTPLLKTPLRLMIVGGEVTSPTAVTRWQQSPLQAIRLLNVYGMTEVAGTATLFEVTATPLVERVPIGRPLTGRTTYLLDEQLQPVRAGEVGELHIGGANLACGYLNQPELTQTRFIPDPFSATEDARLYKTGDLARSLPDGNLEYLGRLDHQVSLRGFRIELGEIEGVLKQHSAVQDAAVITQGTGTAQRLVAYVVPQTGELISPMQNFWQPDHQYRDQAGVLTDPMERLAFKLKQHNLRIPSATRISLPKPKVDDQFQQPYLARQSYRQFLDQPLSLEQFSQFLSCLLQLNLPDIPIPKYRYPSALGLYPVQTYLYLKPGRVEGIEGGFYYYHPLEHDLHLLHLGASIPPGAYADFEQTMYAQAGFALLLVAHLEAITPLYGPHLAREFCLLEAGYLGQLLMTEAPTYGLGLCPIATLTDVTAVSKSLGLTENQVIVHSFLGGAIAPAQTRQWLQPVASQKSSAQLKTELHTYLTAKLPGQMVPDSWVLLEKMPLTPNGKIDRQALPAPPTDSHVGWVLPRTPLEEIVANLWQEVLKLQQVSVEGNFFEVGGNSLTALQLLTKIRQTFGVELPLRIILEHHTIAQLAEILDNQSASQTHLTAALSVEVLQRLAVLNLETVPPYRPTSPPPKAIFLTGATGFVGAFLLHHLLTTIPETEVYCLVRSDSVTQARQRLLDSQQRYGLSLNESAQQRLHPLSGDVSQSRLGLDGNQFSQLAQHIDCIYHAAANVNLSYSYKTLQAANVRGTQEVVYFATTQKSKPIHYISSTGIFEAKGFVAQPDPISENVALEQCEAVYSGYAQSKWVAENILQQAKAKGLPVNIYRLGMITGHSKTGHANTEDMLCRLFKLFIQQGQIPRLSAMVDMIPVDYVVQVITHLSQQTHLLNRHFHVTNQGSLSFQQLAKTLNDMGYAVQAVDYQQWLKQLKTIAIDAPNNALGALLPLFTEEVDGKTYLEFSSLSLPLQDDNTRLGLQNRQLSCPPVNIDLLKTYFSYFVRQGFLTDAPELSNSNSSQD